MRFCSYCSLLLRGGADVFAGLFLAEVAPVALVVAVCADGGDACGLFEEVEYALTEVLFACHAPHQAMVRDKGKTDGIMVESVDAGY